MEPKATFSKCIELRSKTIEFQSPGNTTSLEKLLKEKRNLEETHNKIVRKVPIYNTNQLPSNKTLHRSREFIRKKIHYINCPVIQSEAPVSTNDLRENLESFKIEEKVEDFSFLMQKIPESSHSFQTSIFFAEDLFGRKRTGKEKEILVKKFRYSIKSNFNNSYTRRIAGSSEVPSIKKWQEYSQDPLSEAESRLPSRLRTGHQQFPWTYSSVHRTNTTFPIKSKSRGH
jgi:hypothetical protein